MGVDCIYTSAHFPSRRCTRFLEVPRNQSVYTDSNVTFDCNATGLPKPSISWIKNDDFHTLQSNSSAKDKKSIHSELFITKVKKEDFGAYKCVAMNSVGKKVSLSAFLSPKGEKKTFHLRPLTSFNHLLTVERPVRDIRSQVHQLNPAGISSP